MGSDLGVVADVVRALEQRNRTLRIALLEANPTQTVDGHGVVGHDPERAPDERLGMRQLEVVIGECVAECIEQDRVVGALGQQVLEHVDRLVHASGLLEDHCPLIFDRRVARVTIERRAQQLNRGIRLPMIGQQVCLRHGEIDLGVGMLTDVVIQQGQRLLASTAVKQQRRCP